MPKFAANITMMFTEVPFPNRFERAAKAGFKAVEFQFPYDHKPEDVATWLKDNGLESAAFNMPPGSAGERGTAALPGREQEFQAGVARALEYADALGTPKIHAMAGVVAPDANVTTCRAVYVANLRTAARELARHGRTLVIEPINTRDIPGYFLNRQNQAHAVHAEVGAPNLKVQMDLYHCQIAEGDLSAKLRKYAAHIGHIQIAGVPDRHEPDEGEIDYAHPFRLVDEIGYDGWLGCEYRPRGRTEDGPGWLKTLI